MAQSPPVDLQSLLTACTVLVSVDGEERGTGFFISEDEIVTCAHVVASDGYANFSVRGQVECDCTLIAAAPPDAPPRGQPYPFPDVALLKSQIPAEYWVELEDASELLVGQPLLACGYSDQFQPSGQLIVTPSSFLYEGSLVAAGGKRLQIKGGLATPGMSGSPLLNLRTARVVGMITRTRDTKVGLGAWATPSDSFAAMREKRNASQRWLSVCAERLRPPGLSRPFRPLPNEYPPTALLRAEYRTVPLLGREDEMSWGRAWLEAEHSPFAILTGAGGTGKSRLAAELCDDALRAGAIAGITNDSSLLEHAEQSLETGRASLLVVDYAETVQRLQLLVPLLPRIQSSSLKILLVARSSGEWLNNLKVASSEMGWMLEAAPRLDLSEIDPDIDRGTLHETALAAFAELTGTSTTDSAPLNVPDNRPLIFTIMSALADVYGDPGSDAPSAGTAREAIVADVLAHEERYWLQLFRGADLGTGLDAAFFRRVMAAVTLTPAQSEDGATRTLRMLPDLSDANAAFLHTIARWIHESYGTENSWCYGITPNLLGEALVVRVFGTEASLAISFLSEATPESRRHGLTVISRALDWLSNSRQLYDPVVDEMWAVHPEDVLYATQASGPQAAAALTQLLRDSELSSDQATYLMRQIPASSVALHDVLGMSVARLMLEAQTSGNRRAEAELWNDVAVQAQQVGDFEGALEAIEKCVSFFRSLQESPDPKDIDDLGTALNGLGTIRARLGNIEGAMAASEESVRIRREIAGSGNPDYVLGYARSLGTLSNRLAEAGREEDALAARLECNQLLQQFADRLSPQELINNDTQLARRYIRNGDPAKGEEMLREAAREARELAKASRDVFGPLLVSILEQHAAALEAMDRKPDARECAIEAIGELRWLARMRPIPFQAILDQVVTYKNRLDSELPPRKIVGQMAPSTLREPPMLDK